MIHDILLIICILLFSSVIVIFFIIRNKLREISYEAFGTKNLIKGIRQTNLEAMSEPKSIMGMEKLDLPKLREDFKELNINELKRDAEQKIINCLNAIETKNADNLKEEVLKVYVNSRLEDLKDKNVSYDSIKIHNTILNRYERNDAIATLKIHSAIEYIYTYGKKSPRKVQTRFEVEYIYVLDAEKLGYKTILGLNCPNCGGPIRSLSDDICTYCGSGIINSFKDIAKKAWILNNIKEF